MNANDMEALAARAEQATADGQRELLIEAFRAIHGPKPYRVPGGSPEWKAWLDLFNPFFQMLEVRAFESAAASLVPEGWYWRAGHGVLWPGWAHLNAKHPDHCLREDEHSAHAETPALALTAACLKARAQVLHG